MERVSHHQGPISKVQAKSPVHCQQSGEKDLPQLGILNYWAFVTLQEVATVVDLKTLFVLKQLKHENSSCLPFC
jgi:hypothetical protein